ITPAPYEKNCAQSAGTPAASASSAKTTKSTPVFSAPTSANFVILLHSGPRIIGHDRSLPHPDIRSEHPVAPAPEFTDRPAASDRADGPADEREKPDKEKRREILPKRQIRFP